MADAREVLETMKEVAQIRIAMLKGGVTFHQQEQREYFLREYEDKVRRIDEVIRRMQIRIVYSKGREATDSTLEPHTP